MVVDEKMSDEHPRLSGSGQTCIERKAMVIADRMIKV
jgi:hypothetical protein